MKTAFITRNFPQLISSHYLPTFEKVPMVGYGGLVLTLGSDAVGRVTLKVQM